MRIVFDTNIFYADFRMGGEAFQRVLDGLPRVESQLYVLEVVIEEVVGNFREALGKAARDARRGAAVASTLVGRPLSIPWDVDPATEARAYETFLRERLAALKAVIVPFPSTSHAEIVRKELSKTKPSGYRDRLIWENVLSLLRDTASNVILVTANTSDFAEEGRLHPDLEADIAGKGLVRSRLHVHWSLADFCDRWLPVPPRVGVTIDPPTSGKLESEFPHEQLKLIVPKAAQPWIDHISAVGLGLVPGCGGCRVVGVGAVTSARIVARRDLPSGKTMLDVESDLTLAVEVTAAEVEYRKSAQLREFFTPTPAAFPATVVVNRDMVVCLKIFLAQDGATVEGAEIEDFMGLFGTVIGHPVRHERDSI